MNLLEETRNAIHQSGREPSDISYIGSLDSGHRCTWDEFCALADTEYDSGFGGQEVARDLRFVFSDGQQMWRGEYDGSEWWEYSAPASIPDSSFPITNIFADVGWESLESLNTTASRKQVHQ